MPAHKAEPDLVVAIVGVVLIAVAFSLVLIARSYTAMRPVAQQRSSATP